MLTKDSHSKSLQERSITIPFYLAVSAVLLICAMLVIGALVLSTTGNLEKSPRTVLNDWATNSGWIEERGVRIRAALAKLPGRYLASLGARPELPTLVIDIKFKHQETLRIKRDNALLQGMLIQEEGDLVPANIRIGGRQVRVRLRLKGDQSDHLDSEKWSMRIEVRGNDHILGMRRFSIQHPKVRSYQAEPVFMEMLRSRGVLSVRYQFVHVIVNGEDKGIMALEEHFSKELLEHQARREGVFIRFDEANFWDYQRVGGNWRSSPYDSYRISRVRTFGARKISKSPALSAQYHTGVGMLRSFASEHMTASEVFDIDTTAAYLAVLELWGSWHSIQWNDMRFYLDPLSMKLEPIGYDANLKLHSDIYTVTLRREPIISELLQDPKIQRAYFQKLRELCRDVIDGELGASIVATQNDLLAVLRSEFLLLEPMDLERLVDRARFLLELDDTDLLMHPETYPRRTRYPALVQANLIDGGSGLYVEMANLLPEPVTVTSVNWRVPDSFSGQPAGINMKYDFPFELPATVIGMTPKFTRLELSDQPQVEGSELIITASYANWPREKTIRAVAYFPELLSGPVPEASVTEQLSVHSFLERRDGSAELIIKPGRWQVDSDIIVPAGVTLSAGPGTTLEFAPNAALISHGALFLTGDADNPVTLRGIGSDPWQGIVVLRAGEKSIFRHVEIENTVGISRGSWLPSGGVNFYRSNVEFEDVSIRQHQGQDALNIVQSHFDITRLEISGAQYDGFDADFTTGIIRESVFTDIGLNSGGGDAIDISGSEVEVEDIRFEHIGDKALSVGEGSRMYVRNVTIDAVGTAAASKDGSYLEIDGMVIYKVSFAGLMAYTKKPEYGPAFIKAKNVVYKQAGPVGRVETGSVIELNGEKLATEDIDVDLLYETIMRKGS